LPALLQEDSIDIDIDMNRENDFTEKIINDKFKIEKDKLLSFGSVFLFYFMFL